MCIRKGKNLGVFMKKILLTLMILGITSSVSALATTEVRYMNTGAVKQFTPVALGSNAPFYSNARRANQMRALQVQRYKAETEAIRNRNNHNINLNINSNNKIKNSEQTVALKKDSSQQEVKNKKFTSVTCNGITYYMQNNPCSL